MRSSCVRRICLEHHTIRIHSCNDDQVQEKPLRNSPQRTLQIHRNIHLNTPNANLPRDARIPLCIRQRLIPRPLVQNRHAQGTNDRIRHLASAQRKNSDLAVTQRYMQQRARCLLRRALRSSALLRHLILMGMRLCCSALLRPTTLSRVEAFQKTKACPGQVLARLIRDVTSIESIAKEHRVRLKFLGRFAFD